MKHLLTLFLLLSAIIAVNAQEEQKMFFWKNNTMKAMPISEVDSITFALENNSLSFTTGDAYNITENSFKAAFTITSNLRVSSSSSIEVGTCWSRKNTEPTVNDFVQIYQRSLGKKLSWAPSFTFLYSGTTYYYRPYVMTDSAVFYGDVKSVSIYGAEPLETVDEDSITMEEKHGLCVDLGLSVKWAVCNLGASTPEGYGDYYSWGETSPKPDYMDYDDDTYKYKRIETGTMYATYYDKYNNNEDKKEVLEPEDDAATVTLGGNWRMPTSSEIDELLTKCKRVWTTQNNVKGYKLTAPNGKSIFLPAAGIKSSAGKVSSSGNYGYYWSSTRSSSDSDDGVSIEFSDSHSIVRDTYARPRGLSIRPVLP